MAILPFLLLKPNASVSSLTPLFLSRPPPRLHQQILDSTFNLQPESDHFIAPPVVQTSFPTLLDYSNGLFTFLALYRHFLHMPFVEHLDIVLYKELGVTVAGSQGCLCLAMVATAKQVPHLVGPICTPTSRARKRGHNPIPWMHQLYSFFLTPSNLGDGSFMPLEWHTSI